MAVFSRAVVPHLSNIRHKGQSEGCRAEGVREQRVPEDEVWFSPFNTNLLVFGDKMAAEWGSVGVPGQLLSFQPW